jgi:type VI protein secretion system component VasK
MISYNNIHETFGDSVFADRVELIAYNALPGSMTKDLWTRVYLQQNNEVTSVIQNPHVWVSDGGDSIIYSLEGNYACW